MQRQQQGFTLIELVIVIVILGILSAFALPRFADLGGDAREASIKGVAGSMKSASAIVRSACLAADVGTCDQNASSDTINLEGENIVVSYGYPASQASGILRAAQVNSDDFDLGGGVNNGGNEISVAAIGAPGTCEVTYDRATGPNTRPDINTNISGAGC